MRSRFGAAAILLTAVGCSSAVVPQERGGGDAPIGLVASDYPSQRLFRLRLEDSQSAGNLRLVARIASPERFQLEALDGLGRRRWALDFAAGDSRILDSVRGEWCRSAGEVPLPVLGLDVGSVEEALAVLLGRLPRGLHAVAGAVGSSRFVDGRGGVWIVRRGDDGRLAGWTLLRGGRPELWWGETGNERILSSRDGVQLRWRETRREPLPGEISPLDADPEKLVADCNRLVDQAFDTRDDGL